MDKDYRGLLPRHPPPRVPAALGKGESFSLPLAPRQVRSYTVRNVIERCCAIYFLPSLLPFSASVKFAAARKPAPRG